MRNIFYIGFYALTILTCVWPNTSSAGLMEISTTYSTRSSRIDDNNYSESTSLTGSFAWYFLELSALEISYTEGVGTLSVLPVGETDITKYITEMKMIGTDMVLTFAGRESFLQPFIKGGVAHLQKKIYRKINQDAQLLISDTGGYQTVPSWGVGLKINLTKSLSIKMSFDRWRSASDSDKGLWDESIRAGIAYLF